MTIFQAIILGLVQGFAEFLPISSSGHLMLAREIMGISGSFLLYDILLHTGTLLAIFIVFYKEILSLFKRPFKQLGLLALASVPAVITGLLLSQFLDEVFASVKYLCFFFLISAFLMLLTEFFSVKFARQEKAGLITLSDEISLKGAMAMGLMQAMAVLPAITRSGSTIFGGTIAKQRREVVAKFSFFMSIPIILGATVLELGGLGDNVRLEWYIYAIGIFTAFVSGFFAIKFMLRIIKKANFKWFALYLFILSLITFFVYFI